MRIFLRQSGFFARFIISGVWSGGRDLNLRQSGFCTLDRLNDAHHTGRRLQRLRQSVPKSGWLGSSTKLSYRPTKCYNENFQFMRFVLFQQIVTISLCNVDHKHVLCVCSDLSPFQCGKILFKSKILEL